MSKPHIDVVIKFGGSSITEKESLETIKASCLHDAAALVGRCSELGLSTVVVHGAGLVHATLLC